MDYEAIRQVLAALEREGVGYVVFGAAALNFHGLARFTEHLGLFVAPERENIEALKNALRSVFDDPHIDEISARAWWGTIRLSSMAPCWDFSHRHKVRAGAP